MRSTFPVHFLASVSAPSSSLDENAGEGQSVGRGQHAVAVISGHDRWGRRLYLMAMRGVCQGFQIRSRESKIVFLVKGDL